LPRARDSVRKIEAFDCIREVAHEIATAKFPIGEHLESKLLLFCQDSQNVPVFQLA
jgi:hypothetical protein